MSFPLFRQLEAMDCGPTCLRMIAKYYGKNFPTETLRTKSKITREGTSLLGIAEAAESIGFKTISYRITWDDLLEGNVTPFIAYWQQRHFVVVYKMKHNKVYVADPVDGYMTYSKQQFFDHWAVEKNGAEPLGIVLLLEPTSTFYETEDEPVQKAGIASLFRYLLAYRNLLVQLFLGLLIGSVLQLILPFLTQSIVDVGINTRNVKFIYLILVAQLMLFLGQTSVAFIRSWLLLHISTRINVTIASDFLMKLMKLPISFFDNKMVGDIMQRMDDQQRIQNFLTGSALSTLFSLFNFIVFTLVIVIYNVKIFFAFLTGSIVYFIWIFLFLRRRKRLDYKRFEVASQNKSKVIQLVYGMQEIKLNNSEISKRWEWERIQAKLFKVSVRSLALSQYQQAGGFLINQIKNLFITFFSATAVMDGHITIGAMLAIQYIIGQLSGPIDQFIQFIQSSQDAMISLERLNEVHSMADEEPEDAPKINLLPADKGITIRQLTFQYPGNGNEPVLKDIDLYIPEGKTTAIVGVSGSGKTTLLKLLLKFYAPCKGEIRIGENNLQNISSRLWREYCGVVMQDSYIFSDTIANNIAIGDASVDVDRLLHALKVANIQSFVESLPLGLNTKIGTEGTSISQGQRQRLLIARAVYKDPGFILFDEATNALDSSNEKVIMHNLEHFFVGKTVIVVAHRLSTVKNADQIIVLDKGRIIEKGSHKELTARKGTYFELVRNQLELGN
jgi:ATP-binding cassette subfamily B protein